MVDSLPNISAFRRRQSCSHPMTPVPGVEFHLAGSSVESRPGEGHGAQGK